MMSPDRLGGWRRRDYSFMSDLRARDVIGKRRGGGMERETELKRRGDRKTDTQTEKQTNVEKMR